MDIPAAGSSRPRPLDDPGSTPESKRVKTSHTVDEPEPSIPKPTYDVQGLLPPSLALLGIEEQTLQTDGHPVTREVDVGISEYISAGVSKIEAIIKQRFTDFLVYEVDKSGQVVHLKSLDAPSPNAGLKVTPKPVEPTPTESKGAELPEWSSELEEKLKPYFSTEALVEFKQMYSEGPTPPAPAVGEQPDQPAEEEASTSSRGGRGGRGGKRGKGGRGDKGKKKPQADTRKVTSEPLSSKDDRTRLHQTIRELFNGRMDSRAVDSIGNEGARVVIKWLPPGASGSGRDGRPTREERPPPYIHFTLHKTNRDTQDAISRLARSLNVGNSDLTVAGTKDKRGVTTQRVSLKRGRFLTVTDVWTIVNGLKGGKRTKEQALKERGERGIRIGDLEYKTTYLELGMLNGNAFLITLRNLKVDSPETVEAAMESIKTKGFINYYGMQRFGTAAIPTHALGLAILKSNWAKVVSLLLRPRPGEHPDVEAGRRAWLEDKDLKRALELIPRRCVAERCILEYYQKSRQPTPYQALSGIPRNLRLMYVHAYQSYVWNAVVSERIRLHGSSKPVVGDLVYDKEAVAGTIASTIPIVDPLVNEKEVNEVMEVDTEEAPVALPLQKADKGKKNEKKPFVPPKVKILTEDDLDKHTIFDVIMPLPGRDVSYPGGSLGERYKAFLRADGLDPDNLKHGNKDYTLLGSYRHILHLPQEMSWSILRYTDPDVPLAQSDEDKMLGFEPPAPVEDGKFMALQINLQLGTAAYATMAIREITKTDTSMQSQSMLTLASEDQAFKGSAPKEVVAEDNASEIEVEMDILEDIDGESIDESTWIEA